MCEYIRLIYLILYNVVYENITHTPRNDVIILYIFKIYFIYLYNIQIQINIWDEDSIHFLGQVGDVIQIKNGVKFNDIISIYNFEINSKYQQTRLLKIWYEDYKHRSMYGPCDEEGIYKLLYINTIYVSLFKNIYG